MAIVYDTSGQNTTNVANPTWTHVNAGNLIVVGIQGPTTDAVTGVTYNSVALTQICKIQSTNTNTRWNYLYYLLNPTAGSNTVAVAQSAGDCVSCISVSYTGVKALDANNTNQNGSATSLATAVTTVANNAVIINFSHDFGRQVTAGTGATQRVSIATNNQAGMFDSGATGLAPGSNSMTITGSGAASSFATVTASFSPTTSGFFPFL